MTNRGSVFRLAVAGAIALALIASASQAEAKGKKRRGKPYLFELTRVELEKGVPAHVESAIRDQIDKAIEAHPQLTATIENAPDPDKEPDKYKRFLKRRRQRAFKVNVEVTRYSHEVTEEAGVKRLTVSVAMRMFGETIPERVMAFTGDGSATVKVDIGKKLRKRDSEYADSEALKLAVAEALATSIEKLKAKQKKKKKRRRRKK